MKKRLISLLGLLALLFGFVVVTPAVAAVTDAPGQCYSGNTFPTEISGCRFWKGSVICVDGSGIESPGYRVSYVAQAWNNVIATPALVALDYSDDCVADGYTPSLRMVIGGYHGGPTGACIMGSNATFAVYNGMGRWTNGPGAYINKDRSICVGTQTQRDHAIAMIIGNRLGLSYLTSSGWSSRVMFTGNYGLVGLPTNADAIGVRSIYLQYYGG